MLIQDWMSTNIVSIAPSASLLKCVALLKEKGLRRLPVVNRDNNVVGLISTTDIKQFQPTRSTGMEYLEAIDMLDEMKVRDIMTKPPVTIGVNSTVEDAAVFMIRKRVSTLPVVDEDGKLIGMLTEWDVFQAMVNAIGVDQPCLQLSFAVPNEPGSLARLLALVKKYGMSVITVLSKIDGKRRLIDIRCKETVSTAQTNAMLEELALLGSMRYYVRDGKITVCEARDGAQ
ncbi:MAG: CBS domain-containing protein [Desulfovibrio sp.]|nr:CBS domain-containing protein [Desulfovibrio sp.]